MANLTNKRPRSDSDGDEIDTSTIFRTQENFAKFLIMSISQKAVARVNRWASISVCFVRLLLRGREIARWGRLINVISFSSLELD